MIPILNLLRLLALFFFFLPVLILDKNKFIFLFLKFAGPSFVKLGQILSVRSDLVGDDLAKSLASFQDNFSPFSQKIVEKSLQKEFGDNFKNIFVEFDFNPVASASIAQVHKAKLVTNESVAVKILRPNIDQIMRRDIKTLKFLAVLFKIFSPFIFKTISDIANLLIETSRSELDLLCEASNASSLRDNLKDVKGFYVPKVFWKFSSTKILVLEWLNGIPFSDLKAILDSNFDKEEIAKNLVISYFSQVYVDGFFHADMHPGNLFLLNNGDIGVVDFGIMGKIDKKTRLAIAEILIGFLNKDYKKVAQIHIDAGLVPSDTKVIDLALSCRKIGESVVGASVSDISIAKLLSNLIIMTRDYKMETRPELLLLQKTILLVEGVGVKLNPSLNIWDLARPWVKDWAKRNIGFDAKIRDIFIDLFKMVRNTLSAMPKK